MGRFAPIYKVEILIYEYGRMRKRRVLSEDKAKMVWKGLWRG